MGSFICKQPNGKYCRFSTVVDTLTHINMTEDEYIELCVSRAVKDAIREAKDVLANYLRPFDEVKKYFVPNNNTVAEFNELLKEMGDTEQLDPKKYGEDEEEQLPELTEEQMSELAECFDHHDVFGIEGNTILIDGGVDPKQILKAADFIRQIQETEK